jgi:O-antigen biosynthesis protein
LGALFRPGFNLDMLLSFPSSLARNWLYRRDVLVEMGGFDPAFAGALELDMVLRLVEQDGLNGLAHIDEPMLIRDAEAPRDNPEEQTLIERHLQRRGYQASVQAVSPGIYNTDYGPVDGLGVSIIIWAGSNAERLQRCVESLLEKTRHDSYEILLVERPGADPAARTWLKGVEALADNQVRIVRSAAGNRAQAFNRVVEACRGEYLLLLSEDTAAVREDWLQAMLNHAQRDEVGIVGSKLVSPNGHVRHAGLLLGLHGVADSPFVDATLESTGYMHRLQIDQNYSAVSGDCLMIRKALYQAIGGLDEGLSEDDLADVDLCLNVRQQGYLTVWTPQSILLKDSSAARLATADEVRHKQRSAAEDLMFQRWQGLIGRDPAYNANLSLNSRSFELEPDLNLTWRPLTWRPLPVVLGHPADPYGCGNYRVIKPFVALRNAGMVDGMLSPGLLHVADLERYAPDVILLQRQISEVRLQAMRRIKLLSSAFKVYELDDYLPNLPLKSVHRKDMPKDAVKALRRGMGFVDRFVVSTHALAEAFQGLHEDIRVVENRLPLEWWEGLGSQRRRGRKPRVGWAGGVSHTGDLELIADVVKALVDEVEWVFFGMCPEKIRPYVHEVHGGVDIDLYPQKLASLDLDLALAPLEDNRFNHCKSNLRLLEYGICGFPVVCSDLTPYRGDLPVTRVKNRYKDWVDAIRAHLADMDATARMGDELQSRVRAEWMLEGRNLELWRAAWLPDA